MSPEGLREEIVNDKFGLNTVPIGVVNEAGGRDHRQVHGLFGSCHALERRQLVGNVRCVSFVNGKWIFGIFDFTYVNDVVIAFEEEVDLRAIGIDVISVVNPAIDLGMNGCKAKGPPNLPLMLKANALEGQSPPVRLRRGGRGRRPERFVGRRVVEELEMKQREVVDELIDAVALLVAEVVLYQIVYDKVNT